LTLRATYNAGVLSLPIILVAGLFVGMVLSFQAYTTMVRFGAEQSLGPMVALSLMRELGPVVAALLFAGRAGSAITAEIGLMKTTEQLVAMEMMAIEPVAQVGVPRFLGAWFALPLLTILFVAVAILGAHLVGVVYLGLDDGVFWSGMQNSVDFVSDIARGMLLKSLVFGWVCAALAVYQGFSCPPTARGMANATTTTVVMSRPSTTMRRSCSAMIRRMRLVSTRRTSGTTATAETIAEISGFRISSVTSRPLMHTRGASGFVVIRRSAVLASSPIPVSSVRSKPRRANSQATARYMAPVSR